MVQASRRPEILAPGGDADAVRAAILAGADAVYVGLGRFNARMRAQNVDLPALRALCRLARSHGVRIYVTLNVIVSEADFAEATALGEAALAAGADALILQDLGLVAWFREHAPAAELHASTQLTTHGAAQLELLARAGVRQVNLSRELSLAQIRALTARAHELGLAAEVFVHGAYCVSFSGQCYLSALVTGHSANRGACVQACRRGFAAEGDPGPRHRLNLKDNDAIAHAAALVEAGVDALKIEGRRKGAWYVHTTVRAWRARLDAIARGERPEGDDPTLARVFNRGFSAGYLEDRVEGMLAADTRDRSLRHLAAVAGYTADTRTLRCAVAPDVAPGARAGVFAPEGDYVAQLVLEAALGPGRFRVRLEHELKGRIQAGQQLYLLPEQDEAAAVVARARALAVRRRPLTARVAGAAGRPLVAVLSDGERAVTVESGVALQPARGAPLDEALLRERLGRLGETDYALERLDAREVAPGLFLPLGELNRMRQAAVRQLEAGRAPAPPPRPVAALPRPAPVAFRQRLLLLTDRLDEARALHEIGGPGSFVALELQGPGDTVAAPEPVEDWLAPLLPAIAFDEQAPAFAATLARRRWRLVLSDHAGLGAAAARAGIPWIAGPLCNASNTRALAALAAFGGAAGAVLSPELRADQVRDLGAAGGGPLRLLTIFGPLLCLQTRQCLVADFKRCRKTVVDAACVATCSAAGELQLAPNTALWAVKRPGFQNQLWEARLLFHPDAIAALAPAVDCFVVDLRTPGRPPRPARDTARIAAFFRDAVARGRPDPAAAARIRALVGPAWTGPLGRRPKR
jgi:putative protease